MVKHIWKNFILYLCLSCVMVLPAFAVDLENAEELPFDGYLFRLKEDTGVQLFSMSKNTSLISEELGVYQTESLDNIRDLIEEDALLYVEPNYYLTLFDAPNDPRYSEQWELQMIGAEAAWNLGLDGSSVRIGIIDSGYSAEHEDLVGANILPGYNYVANSTDTSDDVGHGTFVTGIIAAQCNNDMGIAGIANGAEIVPLKSFTSTKGPVSAAVNAIIAAVDDYDCDVLNMSWGMANSNNTLKAAIDYAVESGVVLVAAVGNKGSEIVYYPAGYDNVIGVGAVDREKAVASFSQKNKSVDVVAPGAQYLGLMMDGAYGKDSGTSFSCPTVTAMVSMILQYDPEMTTQEVAELLTTSAIDLGDEGWDESYGYGLVTMPEILKLMLEPSDCVHTVVIDETVKPTCTETGLTKGSHCSVCNQVFVNQWEVLANGHTEIVDEAVAPTCTETGLTEGSHCSVCNEVLVRQTLVEATGHNLNTGIYNEETSGTEACHTGTCTLCQQIVEQACVFAPTVIEPTCTEAGYTWNMCKLCGYDYHTEPTAAKGHSYAHESVSPTCTEQGYTKHTCSCGDYYEDGFVPAIGHQYQESVTTPASCTANGIMTYLCENDATHFYTETIPPTGHLDENEDHLCDYCSADLTPKFAAKIENGKLVLMNAPDTLMIMVASYENGQMVALQVLEVAPEILIDMTGDTVCVFLLDGENYTPLFQALTV